MLKYNNVHYIRTLSKSKEFSANRHQRLTFAIARSHAGAWQAVRELEIRLADALVCQLSHCYFVRQGHLTTENAIPAQPAWNEEN